MSMCRFWYRNLVASNGEAAELRRRLNPLWEDEGYKINPFVPLPL